MPGGEGGSHGCHHPKACQHGRAGAEDAIQVVWCACILQDGVIVPDHFKRKTMEEMVRCQRQRQRACMYVYTGIHATMP